MRISDWSSDVCSSDLALDKTIQPGFVGRVLWNDKGCSGRKFNRADIPRTWPCPLQPLAVDRPGRLLSAYPTGRAAAALLDSVYGLLFDQFEHFADEDRKSTRLNSSH